MKRISVRMVVAAFLGLALLQSGRARSQAPVLALDSVSSASHERTENVVAGECVPPAAPTFHQLPDNAGVLRDNRKGRMLPVVMEDIAKKVAIEVEFVDLPPPYDLWNGARLWAVDAWEVCEISTVFGGCSAIGIYLASQLSCSEPVFLDCLQAGVVNLWHEGIVPGATYRVRVVEEGCPLLEANFSEPLVMTTAIFGDVVGIPGSAPPEPVDDRVNVSDALAGIAMFSNAPERPSKSRTELAGRCVTHTANIDDVLRSLMGFAGLSYPETPSGLDPCASSCPPPPYPRCIGRTRFISRDQAP